MQRQGAAQRGNEFDRALQAPVGAEGLPDDRRSRHRLLMLACWRGRRTFNIAFLTPQASGCVPGCVNDVLEDDGDKAVDERSA